MKTFHEADERLKAATLKVQTLEAARATADVDVLNASVDIEALREQLYELPLEPRNSTVSLKVVALSELPL